MSMIPLRERAEGWTTDESVVRQLRQKAATKAAEIAACGDDDYIHYKDVVLATTPVGENWHEYETLLSTRDEELKKELRPVDAWMWSGRSKKWVYRCNGYLD